jgi:hypothetical protein
VNGPAVVAWLAALLIAVIVVRNAAVDAWVDAAPKRAAAAWPGHPRAELSLAMIRIAQAMHDGKAVGGEVFRLIDDAAVKAPLAAEPFLVRGVQASVAGDRRTAERAFEAGQKRDPRSLPAAYFLADQYFRTGDAAHGMRQIAILARLTPSGVDNLAPYLAAYAQNRANWPLLRSLFRSDPALGDAALRAMAANSANADIVLALAGPGQRGVEASWLRSLVASLIGDGQYAKARAIWASASGISASTGSLLFDSTFSQAAPPPPFNWELTSSGVGLAERRPGGKLHAMFYGQLDGVLARQLLLLAPGSYALSLRVLGGASHPEALYWVVRCDKASEELERVSVDQAVLHGVVFRVPPGCAAQWLELTGASSDMPQQSDVTISDLRLTRGGDRG